MAKANFVKKARKTYRGTGIRKGMSYWWWKFRFGPIHRSLIKPRQSQLTQSAFWSSYHSCVEAFEDAVNNATCGDDLRDAVISLAESLEELKDETSQSKENMPESLQESSTGELLQERVDGLEGFIDEVNAVEVNDDEPKDDDEESEEDNSESPFESSRQELKDLCGYTGS